MSRGGEDGFALRIRQQNQAETNPKPKQKRAESPHKTKRNQMDPLQEPDTETKQTKPKPKQKRAESPLTKPSETKWTR